MLLPVCTSGLSTLDFHHLERLIEDVSRFRHIFALNSSPYKQFNTNCKVAYRYTSKWRVTCMDKMMFGLAQTQTDAFWKTSCEKNKSSTKVCNEKVLRLGDDSSYLLRLSWTVNFGYIRSDLWLGNNPSPIKWNFGRLFEMLKSRCYDSSKSGDRYGGASGPTVRSTWGYPCCIAK